MTLLVLQPYCMWSSMEPGVAAFIKQCLHCMNGKAETLKPRPLGEVVHGAEIGKVITLNFLHIEKGGGVWE